MEREAGGNARWGQNEMSAFPWGAHYVPVPAARAAWCASCSTISACSTAHLGRAAPGAMPRSERLFIHGRWQEGLEPAVGPTRRDRDQFARFEDAMRGASRPAAASRCRSRLVAGASPLDTLSMARGSIARGSIRRGCAGSSTTPAATTTARWRGDVSAWAGIHYFAARDGDDESGPLTWPEGNGWIVRRLLERLEPHGSDHRACVPGGAPRCGGAC